MAEQKVIQVPAEWQQARPLFITFEGGDGIGKTTQVKKLSAALKRANISHIVTREPGGCPAAMELRKVLLEGDVDKWDGLSEAFIFSAARREHLNQTVLPALKAGQWVICDRFADSTTVYQSIRGVPEEDLQTLHDLTIGPNWPHITLLLDGDPGRGLARKAAQAKAGLQEVRFESLGKSFQDQVRGKFLELAQSEKNRIVVINGMQDKRSVQQEIIASISAKLQRVAA